MEEERGKRREIDVRIGARKESPSHSAEGNHYNGKPLVRLLQECPTYHVYA